MQIQFNHTYVHVCTANNNCFVSSQATYRYSVIKTHNGTSLCTNGQKYYLWCVFLVFQSVFSFCLSVVAMPTTSRETWVPVHCTMRCLVTMVTASTSSCSMEPMSMQWPSVKRYTHDIVKIIMWINQPFILSSKLRYFQCQKIHFC